jgi:hypothetical protein
MRFTCSQCRLDVTKPVTFTEQEPPHVDDDDDDPGVDFPPAGRFMIGDPLGWHPEIHPGMSTFYAFNLNDMVNTHRDPEKTSGCCGSDGMDEMNVLCANGHEIGFEFSDCWEIYHYVHVPPSQVQKLDSE